MALSVPIRYINDGEPLNEETLNRYGLDSQTNLEVLFNTVDGYDPGTVEAEANRVVLRDDQGRSKFGVPTHDQHVWRVAEYKEFREFLLDNADYIRLERLRKASTSQQGIVQLIDSYSSTSMVKAPTANALRDAYQDLLARIQTVANSQLDLTDYITYDPVESRNDVAVAPIAVYEAAMRWMQWFKDSDNEGVLPGNSSIDKGVYGFKKIPGGINGDWILQAGTAATNSTGKRTIYLPEAYNQAYSVIVCEANWSGWDLEGTLPFPRAEPTVYSFNDFNKSLNSFEVAGARVHSDGQARFGKGLYFCWFTFGF